jgi:hypothetical protein
MRILHVAFIAFTVVPLLAQSPKSTATVTATAAEFKIPLQQHADQVWTWNRADTPDNDNEYSWTVTARTGTAQYSFGFYLYKLPGSQEAHGPLQDLLNAGQNSVFKEDAEGRGELVKDAKVEVTAENGSILVRITNPELIRSIFSDRPRTVAIHARAPAADYEVVPVTYQD